MTLNIEFGIIFKNQAWGIFFIISMDNFQIGGIIIQSIITYQPNSEKRVVKILDNVLS